MVFEEDFENVGGAWVGLRDYVGAAGTRYTGTAYWTWTQGCNGTVLQVFSSPPAPPTGCSEADDTDNDSVEKAAIHAPQAAGGTPSETNHAWVFFSSPPDADHVLAAGHVMLRSTSGIPVGRGGGFLRVGFDGVGLSCDNAPPELEFALLEREIEHPAFPAPINPCTDPRARWVAPMSPDGAVKVARYLSTLAVRVSAATVDVVLRNQRDLWVYNDGGIDNLRLFDVTPALHAEFVDPGPLEVGSTTRLRFTVTNTTDLLEKRGWGFATTLADDLRVAGEVRSSCPASPVVDGPTIRVTGGTLGADVDSCWVSVPVTSRVAGRYDAGDVTTTALLRPARATVDYVDPTDPIHPVIPTSPGPPDHVTPSVPTAIPSGGPTLTPINSDSVIPTPNTSGSPTPTGSPSSSPTTSPTSSPTRTPPSSPTPTPVPYVDGHHDRDDGGIIGDRDAGPFDEGQQSVLTGEVPSILEIAQDPEKMAAAVAIGLVWTLLLVISTGALEKAIGARIDDWTDWVAKKLPGGASLARALSWLVSTHWWAIAVLMLVNAVVLAFVDPHFAFDWLTVRTLGSITLAEVLTVILPLLAVALLSRAVWKRRTVFRTSPWGLAVGMIGVLVSRLIGFLPGLLGGSTMEVEHEKATPVEKAQIGRAKVAATLVGAGLCLTALIWVPDRGSWPLLFLHDALVAGSIIAILGPFIDLLPIGFFGGALIFKHLRWSWLMLMTIATAAFCLVVLPKPTYWLYMGDRAMWWVKVSTVVIVLALVVVLLVAKLEKKATRDALRGGRPSPSRRSPGA